MDPKGSADGSAELEAFHRGDAAAIEACYRDLFDVVESALRALLPPARPPRPSR